MWILDSDAKLGIFAAAATIVAVDLSLDMGCGSSKVDDLPLVALCRERKELLKAAADHRYALAAAHVTYFQSLKGIGDAIHRFVNEELSVVPSSPSSPVLTLPPSSQGKNKSSSSSSTSLSHSLSHNSPPSEDSHLHFHSDSGSVSDDGDVGGGSHMPSSSSPPPSTNYYHYMRSSTAIPSMVYEQPQDPYQYPSYSMGGFFGGAPIGSSPPDPYSGIPQQSPAPQPPPPPPEVSPWDFLNPFNAFESFYPSYSYSQGRYGGGSSTSSPDSTQVREREGIPDLEEETAEQEPVKEVKKKKKASGGDLGGGSGEGTSTAVPTQDDGNTELPSDKGSKSSPSGIGSKRSPDEENVRKKGVSFEVETSVADSIESSRLSNLTTMSNQRTAESIESPRQSNLTPISTNRTRDIREVVKEIKEQFETASNYGKEVSGLLESGKFRYRPRHPIFEVFFCRILDAIDPPTLTSSRPSSKQLQRTAATLATARDRFPGMKSGSLSSTLEKLYAWEKKLLKEVKDEEKLRVIYEKKCKRLKFLDDRGAESNKIDATQASIRKLLTKISIAIKAIDTISSRIHKLRDEELQPQLTELVQGLINMWRNMVKCHQKQFQAILQTKSHNLIGRTGIQRDSSMQAAKELEQELMKWNSCFSNWISTQKAYVEAMNGWLLKCLFQEPEVTPDGVVPFSPSRIGAPPVFIICNDWFHAMERISELEVLAAIHAFAARVHMIWELQYEERRQKLKAEYLSRDIEKRLKSLHQEGGVQGDRSALDKKAVSVTSKDGIFLPDDERRAALDSMKKRLDEERVKHEETLKQVHEAASGSLEMGLIPIFEAMDNFTGETLKAHEEVRIQNSGGN